MRISGPASLFQKLRYGLIARTAARLNRQFRFTGSPEFRPLIVAAEENAVAVSISPHPDDDVLAVGATLVGHAIAGGEVHSLVLTDGACGTVDASTEEDLIGLRRNECERAAEILRFSSLGFWGEPDGQLKMNPGLVEKLIKVLTRIRPEFVYTPFPIDYHFDHIEATRIVVSALSQIDEAPLIRCYESIIPLIPNKIINVTSVIDLKKRAVACFETQNAVSDYQRTIVEGLNRHRSYGQMAGKGYGEAIFETDWSFLNELLITLHGG
ncbi:PIG-L family deacetylase [bacterium]|nr:PIG-L family deacetylase [bacterium]